MHQPAIVPLVVATALLVILLVGCSDEPTPTPIPTPTDAPAPTPTATLVPTVTPTPEPTAVPTATPTRAQSASDRAVLVALYQSTGGASWHANTNWLSDRPIGEWHGVTTDSNGRVTELALQDNNLAGTLPTELARLSNLTELALHRNHQLTGAIPPELGNLSNLSLLSLYGNQFTGEIPPELGGLSNLSRLWLSANQLTGEIPPELRGLSNLMELALNVNQLTGEIPSELGGLSNLTALWLHQNQLTGEIPSELGDLSNLTALWLSANELTVCIPEGLRDIADNDLASLSLPDCGAATPGATNTPTPVPTPTPMPTATPTPDATDSLAAELIARIAAQDSSYGSRVARLSWVTDGVDEEEVRVLETLAQTIKTDRVLAERFLETEWITDGVLRAESLALYELSKLSRRDPELARQALNYEWVVDGATWNEFLVLSELDSASDRTRSYIRDADSRPPELAAEFGWLANGLDPNEMRALIGIAMTRQSAPFIYDRLKAYTWVADGITQRESEIILDLYYTASQNVEFAQQIVDLGLLDDPIRNSDAYALKFLRHLAGIPDGPTLLTNQPWFADGLDEEETAFVAALAGAPDLSLLQSRYAQSTTITLPLAGEVRVWVFWHVPFPSSDDTLDLIEDVLIASERIMNVPFPTTDVILLFVDEVVWGRAGGINNGERMVIARSAGSPNARELIYHETAHYYELGLSFWFTEGGAEFIAAYTQDQVGFRSLEARHADLQGSTYCAEEGFENLQKLLDYEESHGCNYSLGELFLINLLRILGNDVMSAALRELYLQPELKGRDLSEEDFYKTFLNHTPSELRDEFRDLYRRLHGGPYGDVQE